MGITQFSQKRQSVYDLIWSEVGTDLNIMQQFNVILHINYGIGIYRILNVVFILHGESESGQICRPIRLQK